MTNLKGKTVNTEGLESEDLKKTNHFLYDERTRGIYYTQFERNTRVISKEMHTLATPRK